MENKHKVVATTKLNRAQVGSIRNFRRRFAEGETLENDAGPQAVRPDRIGQDWPNGYKWEEGRLYAQMPGVPATGSPVPWLTSLHAAEGRGSYGRPEFRGNCSGLLIRDLLHFYRPKYVLDPMTGSGTCRDVCQELGIACVSFDLSQGFDAADPENYRHIGGADFVWLHPPYWKMIRYGNDPRCLSQAPTLVDFVSRLRLVFRSCRSALAENGKLAVLIGEGRELGEYWGLPFRTLQAAEAEGFWLAAPEIIRFSHSATSARKRYSHAFIPQLHDVCWVLRPQPGSWP